MADEQKKSPEQQPVLDGGSLKEHQIRAEARRSIKEFKLKLLYEDRRKAILTEQSRLR